LPSHALHILDDSREDGDDAPVAGLRCLDADSIATMTDLMPKMVELSQPTPHAKVLDFRSIVPEKMASSGGLENVVPGMKVAVGVGSRGISNLAEIVKAVLQALKDKGAEPFIVPAMGSHGGATPDGQQEVLAQYGITPDTMGVQFETSMDVVTIGRRPDGGEVVFSRAAAEANGVVPINRVKPHTDFRGELGSGLQKMMAIGFGKHAGAVNAHRAASRLGHESVIAQTAKVVLEKMPILFGVALLENQEHQTEDVVVVPGGKIVEEEHTLFRKARALMPHLPFEEIDLLIVDEIGKEISGTGMDTNVIGRGVLGYIASLTPDEESQPRIFRIFVRDLTMATKGNGIGLGLADFTTGRAVRTLNLEYTYTNAITSLGLPTAKIPIYFETDREVLEKAIASLATVTPQTLRVVRIANTLELNRLFVSEALLAEGRRRGYLSHPSEARQMAFDEAGNLLPLPWRG
jgi:hypothetical protein